MVESVEKVCCRFELASRMAFARKVRVPKVNTPVIVFHTANMYAV